MKILAPILALAVAAVGLAAGEVGAQPAAASAAHAGGRSAHATSPAGRPIKPQAAAVTPGQEPATPDAHRVPVCYRLDGEDKVIESFDCAKASVSHGRARDCVLYKCPKAISNGGRNRCWKCG